MDACGQLLFSHFNLYVRNINATQNIRIVKDADIHSDIENLVYHHWEEIFCPLQDHPKRRQIMADLIKASYDRSDITKGWLCCKQTIRYVRFNEKAALSVLLEWFPNKSSFSFLQQNSFG